MTHMKCIYCANRKTEVINSREIKVGTLTWRRRRCPNCTKIFTTKESGMADNLFVIKRNGSRQRFIYEKLFVSIFIVVNTGKNRDNGDDAKLAKKISARILKKLFTAAEDRDIKSKILIALAYDELKKIHRSYADRYIAYSDYRLKVTFPGFGMNGRNIPDRYSW